MEIRELDRADLPAAIDLLGRACRFDRADLVAKEKLFGRAPGGGTTDPIGAHEHNRLVGVAATSGQWLRLLAVGPEVRGRGIGTALLTAAEAACRATGADVLRTMDQPGNYLAPGIDRRNQPTIAWLDRRGYRECADRTSLEVQLTDNPLTSPARAEALAEDCRSRGYAIGRATTAAAETIVSWVAEQYSTGWAFEVERALANRPPGVHVARDSNGDLVAFSTHDGNNRGLGWFGPAGTLPSHGKRGLGAALLLAALRDVADAGHDRCVVSWIGPRRFYERTVGVAGERHYTVLTKEL